LAPIARSILPLLAFGSTARACSCFPIMVILLHPKTAMMNILWEELSGGVSNRDQMLRVIIRVLAAILLGGLMGLQRVSPRKPSALRMHALVCLGTTIFLLACSAARLSLDGNSRVIQGIVTGIGFIGAGSVLKVSEEHLVHGLTASARVWTTTAVGIAVGLGQIGLAVITTILVTLALGVLSALERQREKRRMRL